jgi:hypothetical protein
VLEAQTWQEGGVTCHQLDLRVTNTGSTPLNPATTAVYITPAGEIVNSWNCTRGGDEGRCWTVRFPEWVGQAGGVGPGGVCVLGVVVKGAVPDTYRLVL